MPRSPIDAAAPSRRAARRPAIGPGWLAGGSALLLLGCLLAGCGGGDAVTAAMPATPAVAPAASAPASAPVVATAAAISGTVAVGAPITGGSLRVIDAGGSVVASGVAIDAEGRYASVTLAGPAPYRLEACGYAGADYLCVYSVATAGESGTVNVTPLTTATVLLATGQSPDSLMSGAAPALSAAAVASAQTQLRTGLASVLASAGVAPGFDFVSGTLAAGSRSGYDGVLDAVGVNVGQDASAFVQITPRLGSGNLYLERGTTLGRVESAAGAATLQLGGIETLFREMSRAVASAPACADAATGLRRLMAANARFTMDVEAVTGPEAVASALCGFFASGEDGQTPMWGSTLMSPVLGRCDLSGAAPVCGVSFALRSPQGDVQPIANGLGVTQEAGVWKFVGDRLPVGISASARSQRHSRVDSAEPVVDYARAIAFEVSAVNGLACAKVTQSTVDGAALTLAYYKRHPGAREQRQLSLWTRDGLGSDASGDPAVGTTRSGDDSWFTLPEGAAGDAFIRNFYRGGRHVTVSLYTDAACSLPFVAAGRSAFEVEVEGVPPIWAELPNLPWPELDAVSKTALRRLALDASAAASFSASWTFARGPLGLNGATVCGSLADCGEGGSARIGERALRGGALSIAVSLRNPGSAIAADDAKTLALHGRTGEGLALQSNYSACPLSGPTGRCR